MGRVTSDHKINMYNNKRKHKRSIDIIPTNETIITEILIDLKSSRSFFFFFKLKNNTLSSMDQYDVGVLGSFANLERSRITTEHVR